MAAKHFMIYYQRGTGTYVVTEPRPWARENLQYFDNQLPTTDVIEAWLINNHNFQPGNFNNHDIKILFNLDPDIEL